MPILRNQPLSDTVKELITNSGYTCSNARPTLPYVHRPDPCIQHTTTLLRIRVNND